MPYLQNEKARTQAQIQSAEAEVTNLTAQEQAEQQILTQAQAQGDAARSRLAGLQSQRPVLEAEAATADRGLADLEIQIQQHEQIEPDKTIERPPRPPLHNPKWTTWKQRFDELVEQRNQAEASASAAQLRLNDLIRAISQADAEVQSAANRAAQATATLAQVRRAISAARERAAAARQRLGELVILSNEIERDSMDRRALERVAAELSARTIDLEDALRAAEAAAAAADANLASLIARRDELTTALTAVNGQIPAAETEARAADIAVEDLAGQMDRHITGGD